MDASIRDLLPVAGGAVGLRAAVAATERNAKRNIAVVSKVYPIRSHAMSSERRVRVGTRGIELLG